MLDIVHTVLLEVHDQPGVLVRVAQVFARRGCTISAIHVEHPADIPWSHMTITVRNVTNINHIAAQLEKLVDVHAVTVRTDTEQAAQS